MRLTVLQRRAWKALAGLSSRPVLFGGAALLAWDISTRPTQDLDLLWSGVDSLASLPAEVTAALQAAGFEVDTVQRAPTFVRLSARIGGEAIVLDLVAEPGAALSSPVAIDVDGVRLDVAPPSQLLVDKLCALLSRQEGRDLQDLAALLGSGLDLTTALAAAPARDGGFSALTLAWILRGWRMAPVGATCRWDAAMTAAMTAFRDDLVERLVAAVSTD